MNPNTLIRQIMTTNLVSVNPQSKVKNIKEIFDKNNFHHLLVIDNQNELVGIISKVDFFKFAHTLTLQTTGKSWAAGN